MRTELLTVAGHGLAPDMLAVMDAPSDFYATPGPLTDLTAVDQPLLASLPTDPVELCRVSAGLVVHEFLAGAYGVESVEGRGDELETRPAADLVVAITAINDRPLSEEREPVQRLLGNCRQFSTLTCALLRRVGVPVRCRAGFADYFDPGMWTDHWIIERWDRQAARWIMSDPQLDETQQRLLNIDFDPVAMPAGRFLTGAEAWTACRTGTHDPETFGIQDMRGWWFIAGSGIRDLAALNKVETHTWDSWGVMGDMFGELNEDQISLVDEVAATIASGDLAGIQGLYRRAGLAVPGKVFSHRTQQLVEIR